MRHFVLKCYSSLPQKTIFKISTDVENFHHVMPDHFKSLIIIEDNKDEKIVVEKIRFLGVNLKIKTRHVIIRPNIHKIHILSGPTKGTIFVESYVQSGNGTVISIDIKLKFSGVMKLFRFLESFVAKKMSNVMDEFILSAEKFASTTFYPKS